MALQNPTVDEFKNYFVRDFPYGTDPATSILDADIARAFTGVNAGLNTDLFSDQGNYTIAYMLLAAHYLVLNLRASAQGLSSSFSFLEQSKSVGSISQSFAIPQRIMDNPLFAVLATTAYGAQYLMQVLPLMTGQVFTVAGGTQP